MTMYHGGGGPTMIIDRCESAHNMPSMIAGSFGSDSTVSLDRDENDEDHVLMPLSPTTAATATETINHNASSSTIDSTYLVHNTNSYGSLRQRNNPHAISSMSSSVPPESIRFQVVVWDVGPVDVALGRVPMTFRVTMFWDDIEENTMDSNESKGTSRTEGPATEWTMAGRRKAYERVLCDETIVRTVDVPPLSLLNVVTFDVIGQPEVCILREQRQKLTKLFGGQQHTKTRRLMRWTCLYKATLLQHNMRLDTFPHDEHVLSLKVGILTHRRPGGRWDMNQYSLQLATEDDSQYSTRVPHGLIVDHARVPDFKYNQEEGLDFHFVPMSSSLGASSPRQGKAAVRPDTCLEVQLRVVRDSGHYDQNIMPLIVLLNIVAVAIPISLESMYFFQRGLLLLNITFVQIGIRMNVDKHLPSVAYQIKMQRIMNHFFFSLLFLVLESSMVHVLTTRHGWTVNVTDKIDIAISSVSLLHILVTSSRYYWDKRQLDKRLAGLSPPPTSLDYFRKESSPRKDVEYLPV